MSLFDGIDPRLGALLGERYGDDAPLSADDEGLLRRAAHRYSQAMRDIRDLAAAPGYDLPAVFAVARAALSGLPDDEPRNDGPHTSARMCLWMASDRYLDLARIRDVETAGEEAARALVDQRVARAFARMGLR